MELWIRSQDKERLIKCKSIDLDDHSMYCEIWVNGYDALIGEYTTKERALQVLDEIQGRITSNECLKIMFPKVTDIRGYEEKFGELFKEMIYEMPEE